MFPLRPARIAALRSWFTPERPGPLIWAQARNCRCGSTRVDRWPDPRVVLVELPGGNYALRGDPGRIDPAALADVRGFVEAPPGWADALRALDPDLAVWDRIVAALPASAPPRPVTAAVRALGPPDTAALATLGPDLDWIHETWGGPGPLAGTGRTRGGFAGGRLVAVAVPFFVGDRYEDVGVITDPAHRGRGLATACAAAVIADIRARGRVPTWTTSPDNIASRAVAARLGFTPVRADVLYAVRVPVPAPS